MKRDRKVTLLCLDLLEYLTYSCEITLYNQISSKDFLLKVGTILKSHDLGEEVNTKKGSFSLTRESWNSVFYSKQ